MLRRLLLMLIVGVGCVVTVRAQTIEDFDTDYLSEDGTFSFYLPSDYEQVEENDGSFMFDDPASRNLGFIFLPDTMSQLDGVTDDSTLEDVYTAFNLLFDGDNPASLDAQMIEPEFGSPVVIGTLPFTNRDGSKGDYLTLVAEIDFGQYAGISMIVYEDISCSPGRAARRWTRFYCATTAVCRGERQRWADGLSIDHDLRHRRESFR